MKLKHLLLMLLFAPPAEAALPNDELVCRSDAVELEKNAYLRALSLDLTGDVPSLDDYAALRSAGDVPEATIDEMLASDAFVERAVRWHREVLWDNVENVDIVNYQAYTYPVSYTHLTLPTILRV